MRRHCLILLLLLAAGCSGPEASSDAGPDLGGAADLGATYDLGSPGDLTHHDTAFADDAGADFGSEGDVGADAPVGAFGVISGECGVLDDELGSAASFYVANAIDFGSDPYDEEDAERLTDGGREIIADGNAGGSSLLSEVFAYEVLARCEGAALLKTETEVEYQNTMGKITDLLVEIDTLKIGVSVTRAVGFPRDDPFTVEQASALLTDKLDDIELSSANVAPADAWAKQILHVLAYAPGHADSLRTAYDELPADVKDDTIVWVTVTDGDDSFLY